MWNLIGYMMRQSSGVSGKNNLPDHSLAVAGHGAGTEAAVNQ